MKKASEKFIEYYEAAEGNKLAKFDKARSKFINEHQLEPPYGNYYSFASAYRYHHHHQTH